MKYEPGKCYLGPIEIKRRLKSGYLGLLLVLVLLVILIIIDAPKLARLIVAIPAMVAASGFLQGHLRFCAYYGYMGLENVTDHNPQSVTRREFLKKDRKKAIRISTFAILIGTFVGVGAALL